MLEYLFKQSCRFRTGVCCEFCEIFKNTSLVQRMRTATSGLINSCETCKWLLYFYTLTVIFFVECREDWLPSCYIFSHNTFDFKFHVQGYVLINSLSCSFSTEVISWMLNVYRRGSICSCYSCCGFKALKNAKFSWKNLFSTASLKTCSDGLLRD